MMLNKKHTGGDILLLQEEDAYGEMAYYFVQPHPGKWLLLSKMPKGTSYNIEDYGTILVSGYGEPSEMVIRDMNRVYGTQFSSVGMPCAAPALEPAPEIQSKVVYLYPHDNTNDSSSS